MEGTRKRGCWRRLKYERNKRQTGRRRSDTVGKWGRLYWKLRFTTDCIAWGRGGEKGEEECVIAMDYYIYYISNVWYSDNMHEQVFTMRVSPCGWLNLFCPIILKIVTNSTEHTLSSDSDMAHKQLVNRSLTPIYDTRKLITVWSK